MVKHNVEVRCLFATIGSDEEVLGIGVKIKGALEIRMLTIELEVPCQNEEPLNDIIYHENLDEVINSRCVNVLDPHLRTEVDIEVFRFRSTTEPSFFMSVDVF